MTYHQTIFACKGIRSSEDIAEYFYDANPHCDTDLDDWDHFPHKTFRVMSIHHHTKSPTLQLCVCVWGGGGGGGDVTILYLRITGSATQPLFLLLFAFWVRVPVPNLPQRAVIALRPSFIPEHSVAWLASPPLQQQQQQQQKLFNISQEIEGLWSIPWQCPWRTLHFFLVYKFNQRTI